MVEKYSPGSKGAIANGCKCPVLDNRHGRGAYMDEDSNPVFWFSDNCPLHSDAFNIDPQTVIADTDT